jgi:4a-hydroxytetrahydrobiopterin dehydratase
MTEGWRQDDSALVRDFSFRDFDAALSFLDDVVRHAVDYGRRPDVRLSWNRVRLTVRNYNHAGVTDAELRLAAKVNEVIDELNGRAETNAPELVVEGDALFAKGAPA